MDDDIFAVFGGCDGYIERLIPAVGEIAPYEMFESLKLSLHCTIQEYGIEDELHCHFIVVVPTERTRESVEVMSFVFCENSAEVGSKLYLRLR